MEINEGQHALLKKGNDCSCTASTADDVFSVCHVLVVSNISRTNVNKPKVLINKIKISHCLWTFLVHTKRIRSEAAFLQFCIYILPIFFALVCIPSYMRLISPFYIPIIFLMSNPQLMGYPAAESNNKISIKNQLPCLTVYRAGIMIMACITQFASMFQVFPGKYSQVVTFGTPLVNLYFNSLYLILTM